MGELLQRMGSAEVAEWIAELGQLRPEDEDAAVKQAEKDAKFK